MTPEERFVKHRPKLLGIAYRMLGSIAEAEDVVQEAYLRWHEAEQDSVDNPEAFLVTVATRLSIDHLRRAQVRRETYVGPWLPEPLATESQSGPDAASELAETLSYAFLLMLERLDPVERAVYILREAFELKHEEVAEIVGKSPENCRQISRRASRRLAGQEARFDGSGKTKEELFTEFLQACATGDMQQLVDMLAEDATLYSDGGGKALAALRPLHGRDRIARFFNRTFQQFDHGTGARFCHINGQPGIEIFQGGEVVGVFTIQLVGDKIQQLFAVRNPEKLGRHFSGRIV